VYKQSIIKQIEETVAKKYAQAMEAARIAEEQGLLLSDEAQDNKKRKAKRSLF